MTGPAYESPTLANIARRLCAELVMALPRGMTVPELAEAIDANPDTFYNVLRGARVTYWDRLFIRTRRGRRPHRWSVRGPRQ